MNHLLTVIVSSFEWVALLSFPIVLLGYSYRSYLGRIIGIALTMSILAMLLRLTPLGIAYIMAAQMIVLYLLIKSIMKMNYLEALVNTSIGYGFYVFIQLILLAFFVQTLGYEYFQFFSLIDIKTTLQLISFSTITLFTWFIQYSAYQLEELRTQISSSSINKKYRNILIGNSVLMLGFICLAVYTILIEEFTHKYTFMLLTFIILFTILSIFLILHTQFQRKHLIDAKKFYLDQEQQVASIVGKLQKDYESHFQAILKLCNRGSLQLTKEYVEKHKLHKEISTKKNHQQNPLELHDEMDELLYAFLINKRNLASLLGVSLQVTTQIERYVPTTLLQVRYLSMIMDDLIFLLYQASADINKSIKISYSTNQKESVLEISTELYIDEKKNSDLKLFDALVQFKQLNAQICSNLKPLQLKIVCSLA